MTKFFLPLFLCSFFAIRLFAQDTTSSDSIKIDTPVIHKKVVHRDTVVHAKIIRQDSVAPFVKKDSIAEASVKHDSIIVTPKATVIPSNISFYRNTLLQNGYFNFLGKIQRLDIMLHKTGSKDELFYLLLGLCFYFVLLRLFFRRYLEDIVSLFFRASMRQQQIREQALQSPLPSLVFNILFVVSTSIYLDFLICYFHFQPQINFWRSLIYALAGVAAIYIAKYSVIKLCGWIFNIAKVSDNYIFTVFLINKILGIALLPFLIVISFSDEMVLGVAIALSIALIVVLLIYRFMACYSTIRSEIKLSLFHYFLYLCAFEIAPMLLIYKVVLSYLKKGY